MISGVVGLNKVANIDIKEIEIDLNDFPTFKNSVYQENLSSGIKHDILAESR
jgi:hypothetical protein